MCVRQWYKVDDQSRQIQNEHTHARTHAQKTDCNTKSGLLFTVTRIRIAGFFDTFPQGYQRYVKCKQPSQRFELGSPGPFHITITITHIHTSVCVCVCVKVVVGWLVVWVLWLINLCMLFNVKSIFIQIISSIFKIQFSMSTQFKCQKHFYFKLFSLFKQF